MPLAGSWTSRETAAVPITLRLLPLAVLLIASCGPTPGDPERPPPANPVVFPEDDSNRAAAVEAPLPQGKVVKAAFGRTVIEGIRIEAMVYDSRTHRAVIADQPQGPGSIWRDAEAASAALGGVGAVNGGFFTPEGEPLGLVVSQGRRAGEINRSTSLGSGYYVASSGGTPQLIRRERFRGGEEALQAGPFLVEKARSVGGLSERASSARTFIATDGRSGWILARTGPCSLRQLAQALEGSSILGVSIETALNLDGGRSSEIWVSKQLSGGSAHTRPLWNKPVRNFLVLRPLR